jgi:hypothetical protein
MAIKSKYISLLVAAIIMLVVGCDNGCFENRTSIPKATLYASNMPDKTISIDSISVYGIGQKSGAMIVDCGKRVTSFSLPFRNDSDTTRFVIRYDMKSLAQYGICDTLTFVYTRYPHFISADCGVAFNYQIDEFYYTTYMLDSAAVMVDEVTNQDEETLRLYYYVAQ